MRKEKRGREHNEKKGRDRVRGDIEDERQREKRWRDSQIRGHRSGKREGESRDKRKSGRRGEVETVKGVR